MAEFVQRLLNMSVQASVLIVIVAVLRLVLRKSPKWLSCLLWGLVAVRLVCPFSVESNFSLAPDAEAVKVASYFEASETTTEKSEPVYGGTDGQSSGHFMVETLADDSRMESSPKVGAASVPGQSRRLFAVAAVAVWFAGMLFLLTYAAVSYRTIQRGVRESVCIAGNIFVCERIKTPFILGIVSPRIYLPPDMSRVQQNSVIAHEQAHLKRKDYLWKPFGYCLLAVYWFNPFSWLAYVLFCRDIELACDERVIRNLDMEQKKTYSKVLLSFSEPGNPIAACPLAFGEIGVKQRIKAVLNYKKPAFWAFAGTILVIGITAVCFLTNPKQKSFEITFRIPAGSSGQLVYSDEEISPQSDKLFLQIEKSAGDVAVVLEEADGEGRVYDPVYITAGMSAKTQAAKGKWFRVGLYADNPTEEERLVHVTVRNVVVRIASVDEAAVGQKLEVSAPRLDLRMTTGADGTMMYYADESRFIFGGYYGLFVYDVETDRIIRGVDLAPIGCDATQGENACEISVAADGSKVFLKPMNGSRTYVYLVEQNELWIAPDGSADAALYSSLGVASDMPDGKYAAFEQDGKIRSYSLVNDTTIGELCYAVDGQASDRRVFEALRRMEMEDITAVVIDIGLENALPWSNTAELTDGADALIQMAADETGEFQIYGIISAQYGTYGMLLNDRKDGEDNWSFAYEPWYYSGMPDDQPVLEPTGDGHFIFRYVYAYEDGKPEWRERILLCGYDSGTMSLEINGENADGGAEPSEAGGDAGVEQSVAGGGAAEPAGANADTAAESPDCQLPAAEPSRAYVEALQESISADMIAGKLPFVVSSSIKEEPLRLEIACLELTEENINTIRSYETDGEAISIVQGQPISLQ